MAQQQLLCFLFPRAGLVPRLEMFPQAMSDSTELERKAAPASGSCASVYQQVQTWFIMIGDGSSSVERSDRPWMAVKEGSLEGRDLSRCLIVTHDPG